MSLAIDDETHFCPDSLPTKTPSGGCRYRKRRNVGSPSPKVHIPAVRKERYVVVPASPWWRMAIGRSATVWDSQGDARENQGIEVRHSAVPSVVAAWQPACEAGVAAQKRRHARSRR
jgi:hypothetical protein